MITTTQTMSFSALLATLVACSSSSPTPFPVTTNKDAGEETKKDSGAVSDGTGPGILTVSTFCTSLLVAEAEAASRCIGGPSALWSLELGNNASGTSAICTELASAVTAGRVSYDSSQAAACISALGTVDCATFAAGTLPTECTATLAGTVAAGGACHSNADCTSPNVCTGLGGTTGSCTGTCTAMLAAGASCTVGGTPCTTGNTCGGSPATCTTSPTPRNLGETCIYDTGMMAAAPPCRVGLACDLSTFACVTPVALGATCEPGHGTCVTFSYCDPTSKTCKQDPEVGGKCGTLTGEDPIVCIGPSYCKLATGSTAGTCVALGAGGAACTSGDECASGACSAAGSCTAVCAEE
jgi:hypothetical protein